MIPPRLILVLALILGLFSLFGGLLPLHAVTYDADTLFFEANVLAAEEAYADAIPLYEAALAQRPSANLHYNLGNAYYRTGDWGRSRIHWERTLAIAPRHQSARHNLQLLLREQGLHDSELGFGSQFLGVLSQNQWIWLGTIAFWVVLGGILASRWRKSSGFVALTALGTVALMTSVIAFLSLGPDANDAILLEGQTALRVAPAPGSPVTTTLRSGERLRIIETFGQHLQVRLPDGQEGFVEAKKLERIRPH